jgi:hypothetical protein
MYVILSDKVFSGFFTFFNLKIFIVNISSKTVRHISKDAEFCGECFSIFEIPAELLLKI